MAKRPEASWKPIALGAIALLAGALAWIAYPHVRALVIPPEITAAARGRALAHDLGCFACHGPLGRSGVANPGSQYDAVPPFHEGTIMMFAKSDQELREYILYGAPESKRTSQSHQREMQSQAIRMPPYRDFVSDAEVDDLVAYLRSASELLYPAQGAAARGEELAHELGCFSCHGAMGSGGVLNPGSLKGYIPGFYGPDYAELVRDDAELRAWIEKGEIPRLVGDQVASHFLEQQRIKMPAYGEFLEEEEIGALMAYVKWLAGESWRTQELQ